MSSLKFIHSKKLFETLIQCFYIALSHISIGDRGDRKRKRKGAAGVRKAGSIRNKPFARLENHPHA